MSEVTCSNKMVKLAANLSFLFKERDFLDRFAAASKCGFKAVEFGAEVPGRWTKEQLVEVKEEAGVEVVSLCTSMGGARDKGLAAMPGREGDFRDVLATAIEYAKALKCQRIHPLAGAFSKDVTPSDPLLQQARETYVANLKYGAEECAKHGLTLIIEPISTIPRYFLQHQQQAVDIILEVGHPNVMLEFDVYHAQRMDGNLCNFLTKNLAHVGHIQLGQVPGRHEPDENGEINFPFLFKTLDSLGYEGWIGCEYNPRGCTEDGLGWAAHYL